MLKIQFIFNTQAHTLVCLKNLAEASSLCKPAAKYRCHLSLVVCWVQIRDFFDGFRSALPILRKIAHYDHFSARGSL